jgi:hypothetical protein
MIETSLITLAKNIQWFADNGKIRDSQLAEFNRIIQDIQKDWNWAVDMVNQYSKAVVTQNNEIILLKNNIQKLEGICLLHGITDLPIWMNKPIGLIFNLVNDSQIGGWIYEPYELKKLKN